MGSVIGALTDILVVDRFTEVRALLVSTLIAGAVFIGCDVLCFNLDRSYRFWGTEQDPALFLVSGIILGILAAFGCSALLFTDRGVRLLDRAGL